MDGFGLDGKSHVGFPRNGLTMPMERKVLIEEHKRNGLTLPFGKAVSFENAGRNGVHLHLGASVSPKRKFRSWGSPTKVSDSTVMRRKIMKGFELDFCWFCGRPMDGFTEKHSQSQRLLEYEQLLIQSQMEKMKMLDDQRKLRERHEDQLDKERKLREEAELRLKYEIEHREKIVREQLELRESTASKQARPLTCYLPVRDVNFDLKQHIETAGHLLDECSHVQVTEKMCSGWLFKRGQKRKTWKKRWFVFNRAERILTYFRNRADTKHIKRFYFQSIEEVYVDHLRTVKSPNPQLTYCVKTKERLLYLLAPSAESMRIWIDAIFTGAEGYQEFR